MVNYANKILFSSINVYFCVINSKKRGGFTPAIWLIYAASGTGTDCRLPSSSAPGLMMC